MSEVVCIVKAHIITRKISCSSLTRNLGEVSLLFLMKENSYTFFFYGKKNIGLELGTNPYNIYLIHVRCNCTLVYIPLQREGYLQVLYIPLIFIEIFLSKGEMCINLTLIQCRSGL